MRRVACCSWSLRPSNPAELVERLAAAGVTAVQLALDPLREGCWSLAETRRLLAEGEVEVVSGMMAMRGEDYSTLHTIRETGGLRPDATYPENLAAAADDASIARELGVDLVTFHAGFVPEDPADPEWSTMRDRVGEVADRFATAGVRVGLETGQESADALLTFLDALGRPEVGVNFDPANVILYGTGDPIDALRRLEDRIWQVHIKDALPAEAAGEWGTEVPVGRGSVDWPAFFALLRAREARGARRLDAVIEREAGEERVGDVRTACTLVRELSERGSA